mmetsp:Transcript_54479/g.108145  ORF Transcript_54479/g.108145 Transcript_54479/m.108145 type:complete len:767 (+) Transcript_54479:17-2317(+)
MMMTRRVATRAMLPKRYHSMVSKRLLSAFVSRHNKIDEDIVRTFLETLPDIELAETREHFNVKDCSALPKGLCLKPTGTDESDNQWKVFILSGKDGAGGAGTYFCHRCRAKGSWYDLKKLGNSGKKMEGVGEKASNGVITRGLEAADRSRSQRNYGAVEGRERAKPMLRLPDQALVARYQISLQSNPGRSAEVDQIMQYLTKERGLSLEVLLRYGVGIAKYRFPEGDKYVEAVCVTFPWVMSSEQLREQDEEMGTTTDFVSGQKLAMQQQQTLEAEGVEEQKPRQGRGVTVGSSGWVTRRVKVRAWQRKGRQQLDPPGGGWGLFGLHTVLPEDKTVVVTEGEYDAMAVHQGTGLAAVSLPNGAGSLPLDVLPLLEKFEKIYLWMDHDAPGQAGVEKFVKKLGVGRCFVVQPLKKDLDRLRAAAQKNGEESDNDATAQVPPPILLKDANDALRLGCDMRAMIDAAEPPGHQQIAGFKHLRDQVLHEIRHPNEYCGTPVLTLPLFTKVLKGFRKGEMSLITGSTGSGKTSFLSQVSLDLARQGVNTLWGSFEVKNSRLMKKMLQQFYGNPLTKPTGPGGAQEVVDGIDAIADSFQSLPLHFLTFHGGSEIEEVIDAMEYAVYAFDVEYVIIDNLQFMLGAKGRSLGGGSFDKYDVQDFAVERFRRFATDKNVHVTLVVHPRKEEENSRLGLNSVFGSAKATQEADAVVVLQYDGENKYLDVKKNRFDGELGIIPLSFSPHTSSFYEDPNLLETIKTRIATGGRKPWSK